MIDVYESAVDPSGGYGAVFERDDDTAFFYLLDLARNSTRQIVEAFDAHTVTTLPADVSVNVQWNSTGEVAGLFVNGDLVALFDMSSDGKKGRWAIEADSKRFALH